MMHREFEELSGITVPWKVYHDIIEPMYIAADVDKRQFIKMLNLDYFNTNPVRSFMIVKKDLYADSPWEKVEIVRSTSRASALQEFFSDMNDLSTKCRYSAITLSEAYAIMREEDHNDSNNN